MSEPVTQYARSDLGHIAFAVSGSGAIDVLVCSGQASIDAEWDEPEIADFNRRLGQLARMIQFDDLGSGASDPIPPGMLPTPELTCQQIQSVMDAAGSDRAVLFGADAGSAGVLMLAATHPERTAGVMIFHGAARVLENEDYPNGIPLEELEQWTSLYEMVDFDQILAMTVPSRAHDEEFMRWVRKWLRGMSSPTTVQTLIRQAMETDVRHLLPQIEAPTLVMHRVGFQGLPIALSRYLVDHIPNARMVELPGNDGPPWFDHPEVFIEAASEFLGGIIGEAGTGRATERVMATVLFTDLVSSTERAGSVGDSEWRHLLQFHDDTARRCVRDSGGKLVKTTGDGILATFASPGRAIHCASTLGRKLARRGMPIRAGIHTGEIEVRGDDVGGLAVHIAARVMASADPEEILVSRTVRDLVVGSEFAFTDRGAHALKGIDGEWQLFAVTAG